jgi:HlyD family secretion protein
LALWVTRNAAIERDRALQLAAKRQVDLAEANIRNADESLKLAKIVLGYTTLVAPFDGVITVRQAELGEIMVPGTPVITLADLDHVWLRAYINETDIGKIRLDQSAVVTTDTYPGKRYQGRVSFISSAAEFTPKSVETHAERVTLVYRIKIDIENPTHELVAGMPADATLAALPPGNP